MHRKLRSLCNKKPSGQDAHAAMRNFTARRCCGGAQSGTRPSKIEGMGELKWACPLCSLHRKLRSLCNKKPSKAGCARRNEEISPQSGVAAARKVGRALSQAEYVIVI